VLTVGVPSFARAASARCLAFIVVLQIEGVPFTVGTETESEPTRWFGREGMGYTNRVTAKFSQNHPAKFSQNPYKIFTKSPSKIFTKSPSKNSTKPLQNFHKTPTKFSQNPYKNSTKPLQKFHKTPTKIPQNPYKNSTKPLQKFHKIFFRFLYGRRHTLAEFPGTLIHSVSYGTTKI
jgi:hypothetical protein